jgi:hypothetical protein
LYEKEIKKNLQLIDGRRQKFNTQWEEDKEDGHAEGA